MYKSHLPTRKTFRALPAVLAMLSTGAWLPALRADIFISSGGNLPTTEAKSYSQYTGAYKLTFGSGGTVSGQGLTIGPDGNLYVADLVSRSVLRFNPSTGALIGTFVSPLAIGSLPYGITFGPDGNLYMADHNGYIRKFNGSTGASMGAFFCNSPSNEQCYPIDLAFGPDGNLYVSDQGSRSILQLNGSTLTVMGVFVPNIGPAVHEPFPYGLHFGPNGNLYVDWLFYDTTFPTGFNIYEYDGSTGAPITFALHNVPAQDFAFGPDTDIYVAGNSSFTRYSSSGIGAFPSTFGSDPELDGEFGFIAMGPGVSVPPYVLFDPVTVTSLQSLRITVVDGPVPVPPGVPVEATLGFLTKAGAPVGPTKVVSLNPGQAASLDLEVSTLISSGRIELQSTVTAVAGTPPGGSLLGSVEVFTASNGVGSVFYPGIPIPPASNVTGPPSFVPRMPRYCSRI